MQTSKQEIQDQLKSDPQQSNRAIAAELGVNDKMVAKIRHQLEASNQIPVVTQIRGLDGRLHQRRPSRTGPLVESSTARTTPGHAPSYGTILPFTQSRFGSRTRATTRSHSGSVLQQIKMAFTGHPLAFLVALPFGGFVPVAVWSLTHLEVLAWFHWCMVGGGAVYSSLTVIEWGKAILGNLPKALGFAILVEGVMLASQTEALSLSALTLLVIINATSCAVALAHEEPS